MGYEIAISQGKQQTEITVVHARFMSMGTFKLSANSTILTLTSSCILSWHLMSPNLDDVDEDVSDALDNDISDIIVGAKSVYSTDNIPDCPTPECDTNFHSYT